MSYWLDVVLAAEFLVVIVYLVFNCKYTTIKVLLTTRPYGSCVVLRVG